MSLESNIQRIILAKGFFFAFFPLPILVLFYQQAGLSLTAIMILQALRSAVMVVTEIPSGYISDRLGRKMCLVLAGVFALVGIVVMPFFKTVWAFVVGQVLIGLGFSFLSGTDSALLYESLDHDEREHAYLKYEGRMSVVTNASEAMAAFIGGVLALVSLDAPFYARAVALCVFIFLVRGLVEPKHLRGAQTKASISDFFGIVSRTLARQGGLRDLLVISGVCQGFFITMLWLLQPLLKAQGIGLAYFGPIWGMFAVLGCIGSWYSHKLAALVSEKAAVTSVMVIQGVILLLIGVGNSAAVVTCGALLFALQGAARPAFRVYINRRADPSYRATIASVDSFLARLGFVVAGPVFAGVADYFSLSTAFLGMGLCYLIVFRLCGAVMRD